LTFLTFRGILPIFPDVLSCSQRTFQELEPNTNEYIIYILGMKYSELGIDGIWALHLDHIVISCKACVLVQMLFYLLPYCSNAILSLALLFKCHFISCLVVLSAKLED
jgi:hypothetical protein